MHPKPLLKLRFTSLQIPHTTLKESKIHVSLWGFTYNFFPDIAWASDIAAFAAAPPGVGNLTSHSLVYAKPCVVGVRKCRPE
jgi:hypothetical protein